MKILTLDLSTKSSGFAIGKDEILQHSGCITVNEKETLKRIIVMRNKIAEIIEQNCIDKIIMEQVYPEYNSHTNKILMWMQAAIAISAYQINPNIECEFINASSWRAALKIKQGSGIKRQQLKQQDIKYIKDKYNLTVNDDQADAICIFDAYWQKNNNEINWE